tara:strand:- start:291 stop:2033 length:1743 start_codon:yes stop_codon:yes gene_type:complete
LISITGRSLGIAMMKNKKPKKVFADDVTPEFGIPFPRDYVSIDRGSITSKLSGEQALALAEKDPDKAEQLAHLIEEHDELCKEDAVTYGFIFEQGQRILDNWEKYNIIILFGGNRSGKSFFAAKLLLWLLENIPECESRCFHVNGERSIEDQQALMWEFLRDEHKLLNGHKNPGYALTYSQKNGFSGGKMILPAHEGYSKGSYTIFNSYKQWSMDDQVAEGYRAHFIWADEECPRKLFSTLLGRINDMNGRIILSFTTLRGWTDLVSQILRQPKTIQTRFSELLGRDLPYVQEFDTWGKGVIYYMWSEDNPYINYKLLEDKFKNQPEEVKLARLYGIPTKTANNVFPRFNRTVNVIEHDKLPFVANPEHKVTRYNVCDPSGGGKPWFLIWAAFDQKDNLYIYREFPEPYRGNWAEPHMNKNNMPIGKPGKAQRPLGWGYAEYAGLIKDMEGDEDIFERWIDPRGGARKDTQDYGEITIKDQMFKHGIDYINAPGIDEDHGIGLINNRLSYDTEKPLSGENKPKLYVSDNCPNTIYAFLEYMGISREEPTKDPIDCIRYLLTAQSSYIDSSATYGNTTGGY